MTSNVPYQILKKTVAHEAEDFLLEDWQQKGVVAAAASRKSPDKDTTNEDSLLMLAVGNNHFIFAVSDGAGGLPQGALASRLAIEALADSIEKQLGEEKPNIRDGIISGIDEANQKVVALGTGSATTLCIAELHGNSLRTYQVGDSFLSVVGQQGKAKFQTLAHAPVAYGVEAGLIEEVEAIHHEDRNLVLNFVGSNDMRIEIGPSLTLSPFDRVILGSDGVNDNLLIEEVNEIIRKGPIVAATAAIAGQCQERMTNPKPDEPSKADDATFIIFSLET